MTTDRSDGEPATDDFSKGGEIWLHPISLLRTTWAKSETRNDLIENEHRSDTVALCTKPFEESGNWLDNTHVRRNWFDNDRCNCFIKLWHNVVGHHHRFAHGTCRYASGSRKTESGDATSTRCEQGIGCAMKISVEDHDSVATGVAAR
jgi:hypothetical protein